MNHDEGCPGCEYEKRREINQMGVRMRDYKTQCSKCGAEIVGEFEHVVKCRPYCAECVPSEPKAERIAEALRILRWKLNDEQLDALDDLMAYLLSLGPEERQQECDRLIEYLKETIENNKPVN